MGRQSLFLSIAGEELVTDNGRNCSAFLLGVSIMPAASSTDCVFCDIVRGDNSHHIIYEDAEYLGFLDKYPLNPGHTQIIPKQHYRWVWDMDSASLGFLFMRVRRIAKVLQKVFNTEW